MQTDPSVQDAVLGDGAAKIPEHLHYSHLLLIWLQMDSAGQGNMRSRGTDSKDLGLTASWRDQPQNRECSMTSVLPPKHPRLTNEHHMIGILLQVRELPLIFFLLLTNVSPRSSWSHCGGAELAWQQ